MMTGFSDNSEYKVKDLWSAKLTEVAPALNAAIQLSADSRLAVCLIINNYSAHDVTFGPNLYRLIKIPAGTSYTIPYVGRSFDLAELYFHDDDPAGGAVLNLLFAQAK